MAQWDPTEFQDTINEFLRQAGDWSQADLARAAGISPGVVNRWMQTVESGMLVQPTDPTLRKVAPVMHLPLNELLRQAGRIDATVVKTRPRDLETLLGVVEAG